MVLCPEQVMRKGPSFMFLDGMADSRWNQDDGVMKWAQTLQKGYPLEELAYAPEHGPTIGVWARCTLDHYRMRRKPNSHGSQCRCSVTIFHNNKYLHAALRDRNTERRNNWSGPNTEVHGGLVKWNSRNLYLHSDRLHG